MLKAGKWKYVPRPDATETVAKVLQPSIRFTRDQCLDLPDTVYQSRTAQMTDEQKSFFRQMLRHLLIELGSGAITAANEAVKMQKLVQIACGVAYDERGAEVPINCAPRLAVLEECIEQAGGKVIVFAPLTGVLGMLKEKLSATYTVELINGSVSAANRSRIFKSFQEDKDPTVLVAHPAAMAHGLTLTSASSIVWYGPITSNEVYTQANGRIDRIGKNKTSVVTHIEATDLERRIYDRLRNKQRLQGILLDMLEASK